MSEPTEYLIKKCRKGDPAAQTRLYRLYAQRLYVTCLRITGKQAEAEEAMQDSFLKIFGSIEHYREEQSLEAWMHKIAVHTAIDYVRKHTHEWFELSPTLPVHQEEEETDEEEIQLTVEKIKEGVKQLPAGYRIILSLYLFEGYDMEEIATIMQIQPPSVRSQYLRAKRKLLKIIASN